TYNGKGFDIPLIQTRYLLNRKRLSLLEIPHFDLLYPARRFWKDGLPNCRLVTIEHEILGRERHEDVPSEMIPYIYFDYLRGFRMERMRPVLAHNAEDIVSLAMLSAKVCRMAQEPEQECERGVEYLGLGRHYAALDDWEQSILYMKQSLECGDLSEEMQFRVQWSIALRFKKLKQYEHAAPIWERLANQYAMPDACVELAKLFEHHHRDFHKALAWTDKALEFLQHMDNTMQEDESALLHRRSRLVKKQSKQQNR
ncbi:ribonuclease H-like domain-containing protein, partial [bacterium]|nr:ribonuclease H-like domain-containing protein [bacterium]